MPFRGSTAGLRHQLSETHHIVDRAWNTQYQPSLEPLRTAINIGTRGSFWISAGVLLVFPMSRILNGDSNTLPHLSYKQIVSAVPIAQTSNLSLRPWSVTGGVRCCPVRMHLAQRACTIERVPRAPKAVFGQKTREGRKRSPRRSPNYKVPVSGSSHLQTP